MIRILYWNIKQFAKNKIDNPDPKRKRGEEKTGAAASQDRCNVIINALSEATPVPDIFVVVETATGGGTEGSLINGAGASGSLTLLQKIRTKLGPNWMLVPPVILGTGTLSEGVSVYYNSKTLAFTGPFYFQGSAGVATKPGTVTPVTYDGDWAGCLPPTPTPTSSGVINPGIPQNQLAGQWYFNDGKKVPKKIEFPGSGDRAPFLTTFWDIASGRNIKLLAYHAPPDHVQAANGINNIVSIQEMNAKLEDNSVGVITGDFNVSLFDTDNAPKAYTNLISKANYQRQINPTAATYPDRGYVCTTFTSWNTKTQPSPDNVNGYPAYGYLSTNSYDNFFIRYGKSLTNPNFGVNNATIVNLVTGAPYTAVTTPPYTGPVGSKNFSSAMAKTTAKVAAGMEIPALPLPPAGPGGNGGFVPRTAGAGPKFREWDNLGKVYSVSDHMALVVDI